MQFVIFHSPQRKEMLHNLLSELEGCDVAVIDDPDTFGKHHFWRRMQKAWHICMSSKHDDFCIMPDDVSKVQLVRILMTALELKHEKYCINLINDNRRQCWNSSPDPLLNRVVANRFMRHTDYCDCGFLSNRLSMQSIGIEPARVPRSGTSSGVGRQLTYKFRHYGVPMYTPVKSLVYHGDHDSVMHPYERKRTPLISK